jgi:hypothetical protein
MGEHFMPHEWPSDIPENPLVTSDHIERAERMIGVGLDVEQVSQWLANTDAERAEIERLQAALRDAAGYLNAYVPACWPSPQEAYERLLELPSTTP